MKDVQGPLQEKLSCETSKNDCDGGCGKRRAYQQGFAQDTEPKSKTRHPSSRKPGKGGREKGPEGNRVQSGGYKRSSKGIPEPFPH